MKRKPTIAAIIVVSLLFCVMEASAQQPLDVAGFELAVENADTTATGWLKRGDEEYKKGNTSVAVTCYAKAAEMGLADAQFKYGYALYNGEGIDADYTSAYMWFKRAAMQNHGKAMNNLAYCYMYGLGAPTDYDKALQYLTDAAYSGCKEAQSALAELYERGILVEQDEQESQKWKDLASIPSTGNKEFEYEPKQMTGLIPKPKTKQQVETITEQKAETKPETEKKVETITEQKAETITEIKPKAELEFELMLETDKEQPQIVDLATVDTTTDADATTDADVNASVDVTTIVDANASVDVKVNVEEKTDTDEGNLQKPSKPILISKEDILNGKKKVEEEVVSHSVDVSSPNNHKSVDMAKAPVVNILFPIDDSPFHTNTIKIKYQLIAKGLEGSTKIIVTVDGVKQPTDRTVRAANTIDVDLPDHDCIVTLYAQNENGYSEPASIRLKRERRQEEKPRLLAIVVGVGKYDDPQLPSLRFTCKDARDFSTAINKKKNFPYGEVQIKLLCDSMATRSEMFEAMEWMKQEATPNDVCMFFYAGHGFRDEKDRFYFMTYGSTTERLYNSFSSADFSREVEDVNSKLVVFVDACFSGALMEGNRSASTHGMVLFASSASDTKSKEDASWENGAFTKALIEALNGAARIDGDEGLSTQQLDQYLYKEVRKLTKFKQTPIFMNPNGIEHFDLFTYEKDEP